MNSRKADISINTIIVAALGLLVLVVLIAVFTGRFQVFNKDVGQAQSNEAKCISLCSAQGKQARIPMPQTCEQGDRQAFGLLSQDSACCCK